MLLRHSVCRRILEPYLPARQPSYVNYMNPPMANFGKAYWGGNYERLAVIKQKYDPLNVFTKAQTVQPTGGSRHDARVVFITIAHDLPCLGGRLGMHSIASCQHQHHAPSWPVHTGAAVFVSRVMVVPCRQCHHCISQRRLTCAQQRLKRGLGDSIHESYGALDASIASLCKQALAVCWNLR